MPVNVAEILQYGGLGIAVIILLASIYQNTRYLKLMDDLIRGANEERQKFMASLDNRVLEQSLMLKQTGERMTDAIKDNEADHRRQVEIHQKQIDLMNDISRRLNGR